MCGVYCVCMCYVELCICRLMCRLIVEVMFMSVLSLNRLILLCIRLEMCGCVMFSCFVVLV